MATVTRAACADCGAFHSVWEWRPGWICADCLEPGNEDGTNRDVRPFDNDPRSDEEIKQAVYDRYDADTEGWDV